ncbi:type II secretion system protein [Vogesella sp. LIG4]|uniref:type II secretion system protein n=1 Tax=Vogesella sp. LIG4 TaxID=1192162 RepID=UPI0018D3E295|nr:type II secretion system protein [Vogesella sp. LIG4]
MLALLIALALMSVALMGALDVWAFQRQRLQEEELLFVGNQYRQAIQHYYQVGRSLPGTVDDLLEDKRFPLPMHHLRRAYPDPITGKNDWQFLRLGDRFYGVYSSSTAATIKRANFPWRYADFANVQTYDGWHFFYLPRELQRLAPALAPSVPPTAQPGSAATNSRQSMPNSNDHISLPVFRVNS